MERETIKRMVVGNMWCMGVTVEREREREREREKKKERK